MSDVQRLMRNLPESFWDVATWQHDGNWYPGSLDIADRNRIITRIVEELGK